MAKASQGTLVEERVHMTDRGLLLDSLSLVKLHTSYNKPLLELILLHYDVYVHLLSLYEYASGIFYYSPDRMERIISRMKKLYGFITLDEETVLKAARLDATLIKRGLRVSQVDLLVASSAIVHGLTLVTDKPSLYNGLESYGLKIMELSSLLSWAEEKAREYTR